MNDKAICQRLQATRNAINKAQKGITEMLKGKCQENHEGIEQADASIADLEDALIEIIGEFEDVNDALVELIEAEEED